MTTEDFAYFEKLLQALAEEIRAGLSATDPSQDSIAPDNAIGRLTRMEAIQAQELSAAGRRRLASRLKQVERALADVERGTYGQCVQCGAEIPRGRLEIMPEARLCVSCSARRR